jgi:hypothetical protein
MLSGAGCQKARRGVFHVDLAKDAKSQIGILAVFLADFAKDAKSPGGTTASPGTASSCVA